MLRQLVDVLTLKSDRPARRLTAYYAILAVVVALLYYFFPGAIRGIAEKGLGDVAEGPTVLTDALTGAAGARVGGVFGVGTVGSLAVNTLMILFGTLALMLPVSWVYMSARPAIGHNQAVVQTLIILPIVVAGIVYIVQNSLALAFSLAGVIGAVRFRSNLRDTRDLVYIFLSIVVGFAAGVQSMVVGVIVSVVFNYVMLVTWRYDYGRNLLTPTASAQWAWPLQTLAGPTGEREIPDRDLVLSLTPERAQALAARFDRVRGVLGKKNKKPRFNAVLKITTDDVPGARREVENVLERMTKRWDLDEVVTHTGKPCEIYYLVKPRKAIPQDQLLTEIHSQSGNKIASADIETAQPASSKKDGNNA
ncbi:MAG: DUF4956 domain-containing protein [Gemmatimonadaceae bacterium]